MDIIRRKIIFIIITIIACLFVSQNVALAQLDNPDLPYRTGFKISETGIKAGNVRLHGALKAAEELETNIYLTRYQEKFDAITILKPSGGIEIPFDRHIISADYENAIYLYARYPSENHMDQRIRGAIDLNFNDYKIKITDIFRDYTDRSADENSRRIERTDNVLKASIGAEFGKLGFELAYTNMFNFYGPSEDLLYQQISYGDRDRITNIAAGTVSYRILPKTRVFLEGDLGFLHYFNSSLPPDSWYIDALVGVRGRPTNKILINLKGGFRYQRYDKSNVYSDKNYIGPVARGGLDYFITQKDTLTAVIEKGVYESLYSNMNYYDSSMLSLKYSHKFNNKISASIFGTYDLNIYPTATNEGGVIDKRFDNIFNFGCIGRYDIRKWLAAELRYDYSQRISRFFQYNYVDNRISVSGTAGF